MAKIVLFGNGKLAEIAHIYLTHDSPHEVVAFTVDSNYIVQKVMRGLPVMPFEKIETYFPPDKFKMLIVIGYKKVNSTRAVKYKEAKTKGYELISYVSSKNTYFDDINIGDNCFILENQVIQPFVKIGNNVIMWSGNHIGHDVTIGNHVWISSHVVVSGGAKIGDYSFIGVNATIRDAVTIGRECIIGAGALILKNAKDKEVYVADATKPYRLDSGRFK